jgi:hypothetical protein
LQGLSTRGNFCGFGKGDFYRFDSWEMKFVNIDTLFMITFCWEDVCQQYITIYYELQQMNEEQGSLIQLRKNHGCSRG